MVTLFCGKERETACLYLVGVLVVAVSFDKMIHGDVLIEGDCPGSL